MATQSDLVTRVLRRLHVLEAGEVPSSEDDAAVDDIITDLYAELEENGLAYFELSDIPAAVMPGLIRMVASDCAPEFNVESQMTMAWRAQGERMIRRVVASAPNHTPARHNYF